MIAKNIKGKGFAGCVRYVLNETCELLEAQGVLADSAESITHSFAMQRSMRSEIAKPVGHIPISFAPEDKEHMTNDFMLQLAKEYMQEMGIKNTQYIIVRHHNTDNDHLHIVYNRIDNDLKLISVNNDFKQNIKVCKKLKDKHGLMYGKDKMRVKREKLANPDRAKYYIYDSIQAVLPNCKTPADLRFELQKFGIEIEYKHKRTTNEIQGVSFRYKNICFKGLQVDRKYSFANLKKEFLKNTQTEKSLHTDMIPKSPTGQAKKVELLKIGGILLTREQTDILKQGGFIYLENMTNSKGKLFSGYVFTDDKQQRILMSSIRPDEFVKYGHYEMRVMDKRLIEAGYITKVKVKWYGGGFAQPYLWKPETVNEDEPSQLSNYKLVENSDYCQSWGDPRKKGILSNLTSALGSLFDMNPSQSEQQSIEPPKKKKKKKRGRNL